MNIWGKILGFIFGFILLKLPGALLGLWIGHLFDRSMARPFSRAGGFGGLFHKADYSQQAFFFYATFSVMGHIAKADGRVSETEIRFASNLMDQLGLSDEARQEAQEAFREGKLGGFPLHQTLREFRQSCFGRHDVLRLFLELQIQFASCDHNLDENEQALLLEIAGELGFSTRELQFAAGKRVAVSSRSNLTTLLV
jgi:DnaJ like chaperone protein